MRYYRSHLVCNHKSANPPENSVEYAYPHRGGSEHGGFTWAGGAAQAAPVVVTLPSDFGSAPTARP